MITFMLISFIIKYYKRKDDEEITQEFDYAYFEIDSCHNLVNDINTN